MNNVSTRRDESPAITRIRESSFHRARSMAIFAITAITLVVPLSHADAAVRQVNFNGGVCSDVTGLPFYCTIQGAVNAANPNDTINVVAGTYAELVVINKTLTVNGAQQDVDARTRSAMESVVGTSDGGFQILADDVTIDGFTIEGATADCSVVLTARCAGIHADNSTAGRRILNNIIQNNIIGIFLNTASTGNPSLVQFNLIQNNNAAGPGSGNGIDSETGLSNTTIDSNKFVGNVNSTMLILGLSTVAPATMLTISNNQAENSMDFGRTTATTITGNVFINSVASSVFIAGDDDGIAISCNTFFNGMTRGVRINTDVFGLGINKNITVHNNDFFGNMISGLTVDAMAHMGTVDATNNWWGCPTGPGTGTCDVVVGDANFTPFLAAANPCAPFDDDGDGVPGLIESGAPNGGDGNDDGIADKFQTNVTSLPSATGRGYITLETTGTCLAVSPPQNQNVQTFTVPGTGIPADPPFVYPFGMIGFQVPCEGTIGVKLYYRGATSLANYLYRKYGPHTPGVPTTTQFYTLPGVVAGSQVINGFTEATESFSLTDGLLGDATGVDMLIVDPSGPALRAEVPTPTLSQWGLIALVSLLLAIAAFGLRSRSPKTAA